MINNDYYEIYLIDSTTGSTGNYAKLDCEGIDFSSTFQVADVADISSRKDAISKTISFKATKNNNVIFGNLSNLNRFVDPNVNLSFYFNFDITQDIDCIVYENKVQIFNGKLHFISSNRDTLGNITYECCIKGYMADFFYTINDKFISDLNFSAFTHTYNIQNISNSWSNVFVKNGVNVTGNTGDGYVYSMIDYGANITDDTTFDNQYDYKNFRPSFYLKEYFNALFTQTGLTGNYRYTVTGSTAFMDEFSKIIIPNNDSDFSYAQLPSVFFELSRNSTPVQYNGNNQTYRDNTYHRLQYNNLIAFDTVVTGSTGQNLISTAVTSGQIITFNNTINTTITASITFSSAQYVGTDAQISFQCLYRDNANLQFNQIGEIVTNYPTATAANSNGFVMFNPTITSHLVLTNQFLAGGQMAFVLYIDGHNPGGISVNYNLVDVKIGSQLSTTQVTINLNDTAVLVGQNTQSIKQVDFLKSIIQMFNLYVYPDPEDPKHIIFTPYDDYYNNFTAQNIVNTALNWTTKIDNSSSFTQTPVSDIFYLYTFNFKDGSDFYSNYYKQKYGTTYGNLTLTGTTNGQNKSIDLIFGSTPVSNYNGRNVPYLWELDTNNLKKQVVTTPRLLFYNGLRDCTNYEIGLMNLSASTGNYYFSHINTGDTASYTFSQYAEANEFTLSSNGEFVDLTFGVPYEVYYTSGGVLTNYGSGKKSLYDRYYANQISELTDSNTRIIQVTAYLNEIDIQNLDFRTPVYFNSILGANYFKVLKVEYTNNQTPSTITLQTAYIRDTNTPFAGYFNNTYAAFIQKNNCTSGYTGEASYYVVQSGKYNSLVSQADADAMAANEAATSGQTFANANGVCVNTGVTFSLGFANTPSDASTTTPATFVTNTGTLNTGSIIFGYAAGNPIRNIGAYYANSTNYYQTNSSSIIISSGTTAAISATTYQVYLVSDVKAAYACTAANNGTGNWLLYTLSDPYPRVGTLVKNSSGTANAADGFYSDGSYSYHVVSGSVVLVSSCSTAIFN